MQCWERTSLTEKNISQEAVKCMDLFQFVYKLYRAKACKSTGAPGSVRKVAEDKTWKELPSSSYFNSLCLHTQQECSFSSKRLHKFKEVETKESYFVRLELIPSLNWESHRLSSRQRDRTDLGLLAYRNCVEVSCWKELGSKRIMKTFLCSFLFFILFKGMYFTSTFPREKWIGCFLRSLMFGSAM